MSTQGQEEKRYDPRDTTLKLVNRPDDIDPYSSEEGDQSLRAEMSCGHATTPESLTKWCCRLLEEGKYKLTCPAVNEKNKKCDKEWSYQEVRRLGLLTAKEMQYFEENIAHLAAVDYCEFNTCPGCETNVQRKDLTNLCVKCTICTADKKVTFQFCWQCLKPWKGQAPRSDRCDNSGCVNHDLAPLKNCEDTALPQVQGVTKCPSIRACPTCGKLVEHDKTGCKNLICPRCQIEFCFVCLKLTPECLKTSSHYRMCSDGVAPRQTSIPVWRRN